MFPMHYTLTVIVLSLCALPTCPQLSVHVLVHVIPLSSGRLTSLSLMTTYFLALHSNVFLLLFLGLPFDRALPWHKLLALCTVYNGILHFLAFYSGGRARSLEDPWRHHHMFTSVSHAYGMEISGVQIPCSPRCQLKEPKTHDHFLTRGFTHPNVQAIVKLALLSMRMQ
jgi:hypothetical protein